MKFGFVTCVQLGLSCMEAICEVGGALDLAITLEDDMARSKSGRVYIDEFCTGRSIDLLKVRNVNHADCVAEIRERGIDWLFIIGWSQIAREEVLAAPRKGAIGMHPTLLPVGRGRAAIPWAIIKDIPETGVTMFQLDSGVDTGPILGQKTIALTSDTTATSLYEEVDRCHVALMKDIFPKLRDGRITPQPQNGELATEWPGRKPQDGRIDLSGSVVDAERLVRAVARPYPGAFVELPEGKLILWAGEFLSHGQDVQNGAPVLDFADGRLVATEWEWEAPKD